MQIPAGSLLARFCLVLAVLVAALQLAASAKGRGGGRGRRAANSSLESLDDVKSDEPADDADGAGKAALNQTTGAGQSRGEGGEKVDEVFKWLVTAWRPTDGRRTPPKAGDANFLGLCSRISPDALLCDIEAALLAIEERIDQETFSKWNRPIYYEYFQFEARPDLDPTGGTTPFSKFEKFHFMQNIGGEIGLYWIDDFFKGAEAMAPKVPHLADSEYPVLQSDKTVVDNCHVYTYASPDGDGGSTEKRWFSRWPVRVKPGSCYGPLCEVEPPDDLKVTVHGKICHTMSDVGAPIMCGTNPPKLSYIVIKNQNFPDDGQAKCKWVFKVVRLADSYKVLHATITP